jgi:hypothetical protein
MSWLQILKRSQPRCKRSRLVDLAGWLRKCHPGEFTVEMVQERVQGVGMQRGYADGLIATTKPVCLGRRNSIAFIEDERPPQHVEIQFLKNFNHGGYLDVDVSRAGVYDMDKKIRLAQFLERRAKGSQQFFRQVTNESDGVRNDDLAILWESKSAACRVKCLKYPINSGDMTVSQDIQEGRFSGIRVSYQRHHRQPVPRSTSAPLILVTAKLIELAFEMRDAVPDSTPIRFQLRFAWSA